MICRCLDDGIARLKYDPYDIKALLHPVDFVVFNGLNAGVQLKDITFLSKRSQNKVLNEMRRSLESTIDKERYEWHVINVSLDGKVTME